MNGQIFKNFPKFEQEKKGHFGQKLTQNRADWYMTGSLFLWKLVYAWVHLQINSGTSLPKPNFSTTGFLFHIDFLNLDI